MNACFTNSRNCATASWTVTSGPYTATGRSINRPTVPSGNAWLRVHCSLCSLGAADMISRRRSPWNRRRTFSAAAGLSRPSTFEITWIGCLCSSSTVSWGARRCAWSSSFRTCCSSVVSGAALVEGLGLFSIFTFWFCWAVPRAENGWLGNRSGSQARERRAVAGLGWREAAVLHAQRPQAERDPDDFPDAAHDRKRHTGRFRIAEGHEQQDGARFLPAHTPRDERRDR